MEKQILTPYIKSLFLQRPNLTPNDLALVLRAIFREIPLDIQIAAFLTALRLRGLDHQPEFIAVAVKTILEFSDIIPPSLVDPEGYVDIVGTGGDGQDTFNVSTTAAIVAAGMGIKVCKHGGKASTSKSGSGDLLKCLGLDLSVVNKATTPDIVKDSTFCFLFAPAFHPGMAKVAAIRAQLGVPTIFNILGPLLNPIPIRARILGVYSEELGESYAQASAELAKSSPVPVRTMVVFGEVGLDEISPIGSTRCWNIALNGEITLFSISPSNFGLSQHSLDNVRSGTPHENAEVLLHILRQDLPLYVVKEKESHPLIEYILMNSAAVAVVAGLCDTWEEGVKLARESIVSGKAAAALQTLKDSISKLNPQPGN
ncbi:anthranilate phosphoribosyltransferase [Metschnikowia bicuspidata]|uniref:Anthranilate phosphoribosyltransferase n=1 Tax=Metschnikowia bicuspidata TaxID=27322 RepID=A0A4V1J2V0_9ASCO|nr:anthranilate phosphoribosyltransferase [Metschnikowia bicuspidata]